jgi:hypothetical protein
VFAEIKRALNGIAVYQRIPLKNFVAYFFRLFVVHATRNDTDETKTNDGENINVYRKRIAEERIEERRNTLTKKIQRTKGYK